MGGIETRQGVAPDGRRARIKEASGPAEDPAQRALRRERMLLERLAGCSVPQLLEVNDGRAGLSLTLTEPEGAPLRERLAANRGRLGLAEALTVASATVTALSTIHARAVIHCDVRPETLWVTEDLQRVTLGELDDAIISDERSPAQGTRSGSLPYIAPEQTGRIDRSVDYRSDFYGLGVSLFECISGQLPFASGDVAAMFHCHIARRPPPLSELIPELPLAVSELVDRLLAKDPDARYQSHAGLRHDLDELALRVAEGTLADDHLLGSHDAPLRLPIPALLFGRDAATASLAGALERVSAGATELVLVSGPSGIGKSSLLDTLRRPTLTRSGIFTVGKCEQLRRSPYDAPLRALRHALRTLLRGTDRRLKAWRARIQVRLGSTASVLCDVLPELPLLLGALGDPGALPPKESEQRFRNALLQMIATLAAPNHPLVIVLDDLQWADLTTLSLIEELATSESVKSLLIIGAYRDDEVGPEHLLRQLIHRLDHLSLGVVHERLLPLTETECAALIAATIPRSGGDVEVLASLVHARSQGNPLFVHSFLRTLVDQGLLRYEVARGGWWWQAEEIHTAEISETMAALVARRLLALSARTRRTLHLAACVGDRFSAELLAEVLDEEPGSIGEELWEAVSAGLIAPITAVESAGADTPYRFAHDRVQEAAYAPLSADEREQAHLRIGRVLLAHHGDPERDEGLFDVVRHLNCASAAINSAQERRRLAELNLRAGKRARLATAYGAAVGLLRSGLDLLPDDAWRIAYQLTFDLYLECMTAEHLDGRHDDAERRSLPLLAHCSSVRERAQIHLMRASLEASRGESLRALEIGRAGLALLGVKLPTRGNPLLVASRLAAMHLRLRGKSATDLANLPAVDDPRRRLILELLMVLTPPAYLCDANLLAWIGLRMLAESLDHGISAPSAYALVLFGALEVGLLGRYERAQVLADAAAAIQERFPDPFLAGRIGFLSAFYLRCWHRPFAEVIRDADHYHAFAKQHGDLLYASYCTGNRIYVLLADSAPLDEVNRYAASIIDFVVRAQGLDGALLIRGMQRLTLGLRGETLKLGELVFDDWDLETFLAQLSDEKTPLTRAHFAMHRAMLAVHFGRYEEAARLSAEMVRREEIALANGVLGMYWLYQALASARRYPAAPRRERRALRSMLRRATAKLQSCSQTAPENFAARYLVASALRERLGGRPERALALLNQAAARAREESSHQVEGIACELAAELCREGADLALGRFYVDTAVAAYRRWGADGVARWLWQRHASWLGADLTPEREQERRSDDRAVDLDAVLRASRALSGEIVLDRLLSRLVDILMTSAGARRCFVVLPEDGALRISAVGDVDRGDVEILGGVPPEERPGLSPRVVHFVARSQQEVVLHGDLRDSEFIDDPSLAGTLSVLCLPLLYQAQLLGVVYLDNNLAAGVFTASRVEVLRQIAAHVAIAVRNANLYRELDLARQRAISADVAKSRFLLNMSHELRTPLNAVMGFAELCREDLALGDVDGCERSLDRVKDAGHKLVRTLTRLLELSRLESGELELRPSEIDLRELFPALVLEVEALAEDQGNTVVTSIAAGCETLESDRSLLTMILTCLLENACRFCADGSIDLRAGVDPERPAGLLLTIEDSGIGIPQDMLERIFERFVQVDDSATRTVDGSGIGLTIARGIAERLGAEISVASQLGRGTRFDLHIRRRLASAALTAPATGRGQGPESGQGL